MPNKSLSARQRKVQQVETRWCVKSRAMKDTKYWNTRSRPNTYDRWLPLAETKENGKKEIGRKDHEKTPSSRQEKTVTSKPTFTDYGSTILKSHASLEPHKAIKANNISPTKRKNYLQIATFILEHQGITTEAWLQEVRSKAKTIALKWGTNIEAKSIAKHLSPSDSVYVLTEPT